MGSAKYRKPEIDYLRENVGVVGVLEMAAHLGRSPVGVRNKLIQLRLRPRRDGNPDGEPVHIPPCLGWQQIQPLWMVITSPHFDTKDHWQGR